MLPVEDVDPWLEVVFDVDAVEAGVDVDCSLEDDRGTDVIVSSADTGVCAGSAAMTGGSVVAGTGIVGGFAGDDVHPENQPSVRRGGWHDPERPERRGAADLARLYMMGQVRLARKVSSIQHFLNDISTFLTSIVQRKPRSSGDAARRRCQAVSSCEFKSLSANSSANHLSMANRVNSCSSDQTIALSSK